MDAVGAIHLSVHRDTFEKEGNEGHVELVRELLESVSKLPPVAEHIERRQLHAAQAALCVFVCLGTTDHLA